MGAHQTPCKVRSSKGRKHQLAVRRQANDAQQHSIEHPSRDGCSQEALRGTGGDGLFYCFAAD
jgi:hypothetical protein